MKILVSNPSYEKKTIWLPYLWGRLRLQSKVDAEWLDPIFFADDARTLASPYEDVDILLLSCYIWNWEKNLEIARIIKEKNPDCYIIAGGPQVTDTPEYDICDKIWKFESEQAIDDILLKRKASQDRVDLSTLHSPYKIYLDEYKHFADRIRNRKAKVSAIWETNRGCPYKCTFCDWGSLTNSKIRRFDPDVVSDDIQAISDIRVDLVFNADANFGIFPIDLDYTKQMAALKRKTGYPKTMFFSSAKNKKDITNAAAKVLYDHNMIPTLQISYQHTDPEVLAAIKRDNISTQKLKNELEEGFRNKIPLVGVVILGNPGDTVDKWKKGLGDLLEIGFHEDIRYHDFMVLPNAPASDPAYVKQHGIETMNRSYHGGFNANFVCATNTFDRKDFIEMQAYTSFVAGYHVLNITRYLAMFLYYYYDVPYIRFYDQMLKGKTSGRLHYKLKQDIKEWVDGRNRKEIKYKGNYVSHDFWIKAEALSWLGGVVVDMEKAVRVFTDLTEHQTKELVKTQYRTIIGWWKQNQTRTDYNFIEGFANLQGLPPNTKPNPWTLEKNTMILRSKQHTVGDQIKQDITHIRDKDSWLTSPIHKSENTRNGMNHYQEVFDNVLYG